MPDIDNRQLTLLSNPTIHSHRHIYYVVDDPPALPRPRRSGLGAVVLWLLLFGGVVAYFSS